MNRTVVQLLDRKAVVEEIPGVGSPNPGPLKSDCTEALEDDPPYGRFNAVLIAVPFFLGDAMMLMLPCSSWSPRPSQANLFPSRGGTAN